MRLADWPRTPYLNDELREWARQQLETLGVEEIAVFAVETGAEGDERRILAATEIGLFDMHYAPAGTSARFRLLSRLYPWQAVRGVDLRGETFRLWAMEDRSRWMLRIGRPRFAYSTESAELASGLVEFARVAAIMAEPAGWQPPSDEEGANHGVELGPQLMEAAPEEAVKPSGDSGLRRGSHVAPEPPAEPHAGLDEEEIAFVEPPDMADHERSQPSRRGFRLPGR